jgi:hypothetical protein
MGLRRVQLTILLMIVVAVTAGLLGASSLWIFVLVLVALPFVAQRRAPGTEYLCALMGMIVGALFLPAQQNFHPTFDLRDFMDLLWIIGVAGAGASIGTIIAWADRRIVCRR